MDRLTSKEFWESSYKPESDQGRRLPWSRGLKRLIRQVLGEKACDYLRSYDDYVLWDVIYERYLPRAPAIKVLEVGSAPGEFLVRLSRNFLYEPYGIEYTDGGAELNRRTFSLNGIDPENVIHDDFFSDRFLERYQGCFDLVISRGFIEHFEEPGEVVNRHVKLLKVGGHLVISVPNFRGFYYLWMRLFRQEALKIRNLRIMRKQEFERLFESKGLKAIFLNYYGTFSFELLHADVNSPLQLVTAGLHAVQKILNVGFRLLFRDEGKESRIFSPHLLFIGQRTG